MVPYEADLKKINTQLPLDHVDKKLCQILFINFKIII